VRPPSSVGSRPSAGAGRACLDEVVTLAHGAGGKASAALLDAVFLPAFSKGTPGTQTDAAVLELPSGERLAFSTDSFVVKPLRFPGGSAGHLAVHGTVNDLAMMGARPLALSAAFVLEEGFSIESLREIVADMAEAAATAGVPIVTGDTKVVDHGAADGMYISTSGVGLIPAGRELSAASVREGDVVIASGTIGDHGTAVMLARGDLASGGGHLLRHRPPERPDGALAGGRPVHPVAAGCHPGRCGHGLQRTGPGQRSDGGARGVGPPAPGRRSQPPASSSASTRSTWPTRASSWPVVAPDEAAAALTALRGHPLGADAVRIGEIRPEPPGIVVLVTTFGGTRIVDMLVGDPLPRIC